MAHTGSITYFDTYSYRMASKFGSLGQVQGPNGHVFFERQGNPDGQSILFIHGLGGTTNAFQNLVPDLQDCDVIRFDWSGHGRSAIPQSSSLGSYVADCEAVIGHLRLQSIVVVAHSLGGLIALHLAAKIPDAVKALVLLGPVRPPSKDGQEALSARAEAVRKHGMGNIADTVISNAFSNESLVKRKAEAALAREMLTRQNRHGYALAVEALRDSDAPQWARIKSKTIIVSGEQDKVSTVLSGEATVSDIGSRASQVTLPGVGHWHMLEAPEKCIEIIKSIC